MKKVLLLGVMFSLFFFSCKASVDSDSQQELSPENDTPIPQQTQETYVEIINNSVYPIDLYSSPARNDEYSLIGANIAPKNTYKILVTDKSKELVYYVVFHIRIAELDVPYWDNDSVLIIAVRKGELSKGKVPNPTIDVGHVSWLILENRSLFGLRLVKNSLELVPENRSEESSLLNSEEFGVYKVYASEFNNLKIKKASNSAEIEVPLDEIESGKIYKLVVDDDLKCSLESTLSFNYTISYQYPESYKGEKINKKSVVIGESLTVDKHLPTLPSEIGYVFDGWYIGDEQVTERYVIRDNIQLTPKWNLIQYKIEYELNGGENNPENDRTSYTIKDIPEDSELEIVLKNPIRNIDEFSGWYVNENFSGKPVTKITINANSLGDIKVYAKWIDKCTVQYETKYGTIPDAAIIKKGEKLTSEQLPELTNGDYIFDGWYIGETKVIAGEYTVTNNVMLTAGWGKYLDSSRCVSYHDITKTLLYDFSQYQESGNIESKFNYSRYSDGVLIVYPMENESIIKKVIFKGSYQTRSENNHLIDSEISGLCIKLSENWSSTATVVFENFAFESSKPQPLIDSPADLLIEYKGNNKFSSSASKNISLIHGLKNIDFKATDSSGMLTIRPNQVTKDYVGSIAVEATNTVTIDGGRFSIERSDGWNDNNVTEGRRGGNGASGIKASNTVVKNNAIVNITAGKGADGNVGSDGSKGDEGRHSSEMWNNGGRGYDGGIGYSGGDGGNGGTAVEGNLEVIAGMVTLEGGDGGNGGKGGKGGNGGQGGTSTALNTHPGDGGNGGTGGTGGKAGDGGDAISGTLKKASVSVLLTEGKAGMRGIGGDGGNPGVAGKQEGISNSGGSRGQYGEVGALGGAGKDGVQHR